MVPVRYRQYLSGDVTYLELLDVVGRDVEADADRDEDEADDEEGGQHGSGGEDGLPGGQPLLLEGRVLGLLAPQAAAATGPGHCDVSVLVFGVVARRHHDCWHRRNTPKLNWIKPARTCDDVDLKKIIIKRPSDYLSILDV